MSKPSRKLCLTQRDEAVLKAVYEQKSYLFEQIREEFFSQVHPMNVYKRLSRLEQGGYLSKGKVRIKGRWLMYFYLTPRGFREIERSLDFEIISPCFLSSSVVHDLRINDIKRALKGKGMVKQILSENILQTSNGLQKIRECRPLCDLRSDMAVCVETRQGNFWLPFEWEASCKNKARVLSKLKSYYLISQIVAVVYVCENQKIEKFIRNCDGELGQKSFSKVFTCKLDDVLGGRDKLSLINTEGAELILK